VLRLLAPHATIWYPPTKLYFSVVIPSKNEEKQIGTLLKSIREQTLQPRKIILSDKSSDHTREIARNFDVEIVDGQDDGYIGKARNTGAAHAEGEVIMFLDADTELTTCTFFEDAMTCFEAMELEIASCYYNPSVMNWKSFLMFHSINFCKRLDGIFKVGLTTGGGFIIVDKEVFNRTGGFREDLKLSEDVNLVWRMVRAKCRYGLLPLSINVSSRRFSEASVPSILSSIAGGTGSIASNVLTIPWVTRLRDRFETWYGKTGGDVVR
jgi:glycosyltransferase involved in cell wall biosynthesis